MMNFKGVGWCVGMASVVLVLCSVSVKAQNDITVTFENQNTSYDPSDVWVMFNANGDADSVANFNGQQIQAGDQYTLQQLMGSTNPSEQGVTLSDYSGRIYVSLGESFASSTPQFVNAPSTVPDYANSDYYKRFDKVELTQLSDPGSLSQGNLTSVDYFGIPMEVSFTTQGGDPVPSQTKTYNVSGNQMINRLNSASTNLSQSQVTYQSDIKRILAPQHAPSAYNSFTQDNGYLDHIVSWQNEDPGNNVTTIKGLYNGLASPASNRFEKQGYTATATVIKDGSGQYSVEFSDVTGHTYDNQTGVPNIGSGNTITIPVSQMTDANIYGANPEFITNSGSLAPQENDVYAAVVRDFFGGLNNGFIASIVEDSNTGEEFGLESSDNWVGKPLDSEYIPGDVEQEIAFSELWTGGEKFFNEYAAEFFGVSNSYGFAYSDFLNDPLFTIDGNNMKITILADIAIPEPTTAVLLGLGSVLVFTGRRRSCRVA